MGQILDGGLSGCPPIYASLEGTPEALRRPHDPPGNTVSPTLAHHLWMRSLGTKVRKELAQGYPVTLRIYISSALHSRMAMSYPSVWRRYPGSMQTDYVGSEDRTFLLAERVSIAHSGQHQDAGCRAKRFACITQFNPLIRLLFHSGENEAES